MNYNSIQPQAHTISPQEKWPTVTLGDFIEETNKRNTNEAITDVKGISTKKEFREPNSRVDKNNLHNYKLVNHQEFAYVPTTDTWRCLAVCLSEQESPFVVSPIYITFKIKDNSKLLPKYLQLFFLRHETDRYARFNSWGSARENFNWDDMCRIKIILPPIKIQQSYIDTYSGLTTLINENETLVRTLEAAVQAYVVRCRKKWPLQPIGNFILPFSRKNINNLSLSFMGLNKEKSIIPTPANTTNLDKQKYNILKKGEFAFSGMQTGRDECIRIALSEINEDILLSPAYTTFKIKDTNKILPEFLLLNFKSDEMDRLRWFKRDSTVRSNLDWNRFCEIKIPLPPIKVQEAIVALYHCAEEARKIAAEAKAQLAEVCPAMIQRASHHP